MRFNWKEYYSIAEQLFNNPGQVSSSPEAVYRLVISRAYYSVFVQSRNYLRDVIGLKIPKRDVHRYVSQTFTDSQNQTSIKTGIRLIKLSAYRNLADYEDNLFEAKSVAQKALRLALQVATDLDKL